MADKMEPMFVRGAYVRKKSGSWWEGYVMGCYSTEQTPDGVAVQLPIKNGPVQIYPATALEHAETRSFYAAGEVQELTNRLEKAEAERDGARQALEHDRSVVVDAVNEIKRAFDQRSWLLDGRGPYEWDDDRYRNEFRGAYDDLAKPIEVLRRIGRDWSNCPTDHEEIMRSRVDWETRTTAAEAALAEARKVARHLDCWLAAALECEKWVWNGDQRSFAELARSDLREWLEANKGER